MGLEQIQAKRAYFDSNIFIYFVERHPDYVWKVRALIQHLDDIGCTIVTSDLTLAECLVRPFADKDEKSILAYKECLQSSVFLHVEPVSTDVLISAAEARSTLGNKLPDSIHIATAMQLWCDIFVGNDRGIKLPSFIQPISPKELV